MFFFFFFAGRDQLPAVPAVPKGIQGIEVR